jgi:hypothetical protein
MRINKSTRRHAQELIGNLQLLQEAYFHLNKSVIMNMNFANYLFNQFIGHGSNDSSQNYRLRHESKSDDKVVRLLFPFAKCKYYQTLHIGKIRLCTRSYSEGKAADDSNIIFLLNGVKYPGKVRTIFTVDDGEPHLLVGYLVNLIPLTCEIDEKENFVYSNIVSTATSQWNYVPIELKDFIEKCVFFRSPKGISYFLRYPTLEHCS